MIDIVEKEVDSAKMIIIGLAIGLILGGVIGYLYSTTTNKGAVVSALNEEEVRKNAEVFINNNLLQPGVSAKVQNITKNAGVYELDVLLSRAGETQIIKSYISIDGSILFPSGINMNESIPELTPQSPQPETQVDMRALIDDDPWAGSMDAAVIVVEFSDFQCPFCATVLPTVIQIKQTYGDQILFVYRDFPLSSIHPEAVKAAEAAQCANDQDKFWEYHDLLFEKQKDWEGIGSPKFKEYASDLGFETDLFNECLDGGKYSKEVEQDFLEGQHFGVTGTPTFFINGRRVVGAQPFSTFQSIIDEELA